MFHKHLFQWSIPAILETISKSIVLAASILLLEKFEFGIMTAAMLVFNYHVFISLGITDGLMIKLPGYFVKNRLEDIKKSLSISLIYIVPIIFILISIGLIAYFFYEKTLFLHVALIYGLATIPYQYYYHYLLLNRFTYSFEITQKARFLIVATRIFIQIPLLIKYGLLGVAYGELIVYSLASIYITFISKLRLKSYFDKETFKKLLLFGVPILAINLVGTLAATFEKLIASIFLDFQSIASIGALTFIGSIFLIISSQLLSLFSQYSREFLVLKPNQKYILFGSYISFIKTTTALYTFFLVILFQLLEKYLIPTFAFQYDDIISFFPLIFVLFYLRICISSNINFLLILGERTKIALSHCIFILSSLVFVVFTNFTNENIFSIDNFLISIIFGGVIQMVFLLSLSAKITKSRIETVWMLSSVIIFLFLGHAFYINIFDNWIIHGMGFIIFYIAFQILFINTFKLLSIPKNFISLLKKENQ